VIPPRQASTAAGIQERKLQMLTFWRDGLERQLAAINASISTLQRQMQDSADA